MLMYQIELSKKVFRFINSLRPKEKIRITQAFEKLCENPYSGDSDIKKMKGHDSVYRLRIGNYRFLYKIDNDILIIFMFDAGHRKDIYREINP